MDKPKKDILNILDFLNNINIDKEYDNIDNWNSFKQQHDQWHKEELFPLTTYAKNYPIHWEILTGKINLLTSLLEQTADINIKDEYGLTPLHLAITSEKINIIELLLDKGSDADIQTPHGYTPLHIAVTKCNVAIVGILLMRGAHKNKKNKDDLTALELAEKLIKQKDYNQKKVSEIIQLLKTT